MATVVINHLDGSVSSGEMNTNMLEVLMRTNAEAQVEEAIAKQDTEEILDIASALQESIEDETPILYSPEIVAKIADYAKKHNVNVDVSRAKYKDMPELTLDENLTLLRRFS